jgi:hypothetical protein
MDKQKSLFELTAELIEKLLINKPAEAFMEKWKDIFDEIISDVEKVQRTLHNSTKKGTVLCFNSFSKFKEFRKAIVQKTKVSLTKAKDFVKKFYDSFGEFCKTGNAIFTFIRMVIDIIDIFTHKDTKEPSLVLF